MENDRLAAEVLAACRARRLKIAIAESCTGGLVAAALTSIAGSSDVVDRGFVVYANEAKTELLGIPTEMLERTGAVSKEVVRAMAEGALAFSRADLSVAVTGIAGPGGSTPEKPVGLVHFAVARRGSNTIHEYRIFTGDRRAVREQSVAFALALLRRQALRP